MPLYDCACIFNLDNIFIGFHGGSIIVKPKVLTSMEKPDARLKAERIDLQIDEVRHPSDTQKLKVYNMSILSQKIFAWLLVELYFLFLLTNGITFLFWSGVISSNHTAQCPKPL